MTLSNADKNHIIIDVLLAIGGWYLVDTDEGRKWMIIGERNCLVVISKQSVVDTIVE